jgi:hypothetical protein
MIIAIEIMRSDTVVGAGMRVRQIRHIRSG